MSIVYSIDVFLYQLGDPFPLSTNFTQYVEQLEVVIMKMIGCINLGYPILFRPLSTNNFQYFVKKMTIVSFNKKLLKTFIN